MKKIIVIFLFVILTIGMTYPLLFNFSTMIPGFHSTGEPFGALWKFWWFKYSWMNKMDYGLCPLVAAPFGYDVNLSEGITYPAWTFINRLLSILTNEAMTYNIQIMLSFVFSGFFVYLIVYYLSQNFMAALIAGIIYAFSPYHFVRSWQHLGLAQIQWMPLYVYGLIRLHKERTPKAFVFCVFALCLVVFFDYYYAYFMMVATGAFIFYCLTDFLLQRQRADFKSFWQIIGLVILVLLLSFLITLPANWAAIKTFYLGVESSKLLGQGGAIKDFGDLFKQSARPLSYFLPFSENPLLGGITRKFIGSPYYGESFTEHTLYLGFVPLVLAFVAFKRWKGIKKQSPVTSHQSPDRTNFYTGFFVFLAIAAWLFSQPPWWRMGPLKIYMPSFFMYKILPVFRAYCRFGIVVMLAISVLAGLGLNSILGRFKSRRTKIAVAGAFVVLVLFEFWSFPPYKVISVDKVPQVYYWLRQQPGSFTIAEYPLDADGTNEMYSFYQTKHTKKMINGTKIGSYANQVAGTITRLSSFQTAQVLKWMSVKYILVHREAYLNSEKQSIREELTRIPKNPGLKLIKGFPSEACLGQTGCTQETGPIDVYEVITETAVPPQVFYQ